MRLRLLTSLVKWTVSLGLLAGLGFGLFLAHQKMRAERGAEEVGKGGTPAAGKESFVGLEDDEAERYGLEARPAQAVRWYPRLTVYGRVVPNPQATAEVRSPFAGTLRPAHDAPWPALGQHVRAGQALGRVEVRVGPEVRLDLENKLADARIRRQGAEEEVKLQQGRVDSLKGVTSQQILSRAELDAALIQLAQAKNQLATARAAAELWQKALREVESHKGGGSSRWSQPLAAPADGEVTELAGRPGTSVEAGAPVLTVVDFRRPLVRLDLPPEVLTQGGPPRQVQVQVPLSTSPPLGGAVSRAAAPSLEVHLVGPAPRVDAASQFVSYWYTRLPEKDSPARAAPGGGAASALWRPGMQVTAEVRADGAAPQEAVAVPAEAVLYHEGRPLVYVRVGPEKYQRREVRLLGREGDDWVLSARGGALAVGVAPGEAVVRRAAQVLLSKEFLSAAGDADD